MKILKTIISLAAAFSGNLFAQGDAELFETSKNDAKKFVGLLPEQIKTIAVISPGSHPGKPLHKKGIEFLQKAGYKVKIMPNAFVRQKEKAQAPLAGRLADFYQAWNDPEVDMIFCIRGGMGSENLLDNLDWKKLKKRPELYVQGYSDATLIVCALVARNNGHPIAGVMAGSLPGITADAIDAMKKINHGEQLGPIKVETLIPGDCRGLPLAGSLWKLCRLVDKNCCPDATGRIIFIEASKIKPEQVREKLQYMIDKKFFVGAAGVVFGQFAKIDSPAELQKVLKEIAPKFGVPVYNGYPFGHISRCYSVDFSRSVEIRNGSVVFPAVEKK